MAVEDTEAQSVAPSAGRLVSSERAVAGRGRSGPSPTMALLLTVLAPVHALTMDLPSVSPSQSMDRLRLPTDLLRPPTDLPQSPSPPMDLLRPHTDLLQSPSLLTDRRRLPMVPRPSPVAVTVLLAVFTLQDTDPDTAALADTVRDTPPLEDPPLDTEALRMATLTQEAPVMRLRTSLPPLR